MTLRYGNLFQKQNKLNIFLNIIFLKNPANPGQAENPVTFAQMEPRYKIEINGKDATTDLTPYVESLAYTDRVAGQSDEAEFTVNNADGRFTGANPAQDWTFSKGDKVDISMGYGDDLTPCGTFTVDQVEAQYSPAATVTVRALAAGVNSPLRTRKTVAHEGKSLKSIAKSIADDHGFTIDDGTDFTNREFADWHTEREVMLTAAGSIRVVILMLSGPTQPIQFLTAITAANNQYPKLLDTAARLTAKGRPAEGTEIRQTAELWYRAWRNKYFPAAKQTIGIATAFADRLGAIAASLVDVDRTVTRSKLDIVTSWQCQDNETDLQYITRISKAHGILFSVRGTVMVFTSIYDVEGGPVLDGAKFTPRSVSTARFTDRQVKTYVGAEVSWHDPDKGEAIVSRYVQAQPPPTALPGSYQVFQSVNEFGTGEVLKVKQRVETQAQADEVAKAAIHQSVSHEKEGEITVDGSPFLCAGINIELSGYGMWDGKWAVVESRHTIDSGGGYWTALKIKRGK